VEVEVEEVNQNFEWEVDSIAVVVMDLNSKTPSHALLFFDVEGVRGGRSERWNLKWRSAAAVVAVVGCFVVAVVVADIAAAIIGCWEVLQNSSLMFFFISFDLMP